jgi:aryl-alcohol dehydrogenase-like predicted oxidoreductase
MRLSTRPDRHSLDAEAVIHAALDAGVTLLDTADVYCHDETDIGHNERLIARALAGWPGDRSAVTVATKGGLTRPGGQWVPDGRAKHLARACEASLRALNVSVLDLYQLHAVDPRTPLETSVRALATLQRQGLIRQIGLSNVTVGQIETARKIAEIAAVQVSLGPFDDENLRNGVAEYCRDHALRLIAYRPLGGSQGVARLARDPELTPIAERHAATPPEIVLAWLRDLDPCVIPIPGATRVETARSLAKAGTIRLTDADRQALDQRFPAGRLLRTRRASRRARPHGTDEVVLIMGMPAAGKSSVARELEAEGYFRLNRDSRGGSLTALVPELAQGLANGQRRWVLDNTYASRSARNRVIECAWEAGVPVRCIWLTTELADAQINAIERLLEAHGRLPMPEEIRQRSRTDHRYFGPDAQFRWQRALEPPVPDEGFEVIEERTFVRREAAGRSGRGVILDLDVLGAYRPDGGEARIPAERYERLARWHADGWKIQILGWRPQSAPGSPMLAPFLDLPGLETAYCAHDAGPPVCWCRKPIPGLVLEFARRHLLRVSDCTVVGSGAADRTMAERLGAVYMDPARFFGGE